mgnify:CR=1 FL=1
MDSTRLNYYERAYSYRKPYYGSEVDSVTSPENSEAPNDEWSRDWNEEFQTLIESLAGADNSKLLDTYSKLSRLAQDFTHVAKAYGKIIIMEKELPYQRKTIKPELEMGGVAGGLKYIHSGILFKFSVDRFGIYGKDDEMSAKAAAHELKGFKEVFESRIPGLCIPLMCIIDYRGFRLIAMSILPLQTLVYGSQNSGKDVHASDALMNEKMEQLAKTLNLKGHQSGLTNSKFLYGPCDMEGHRGIDQRLYLLDLHRLFPPEKPPKGYVLPPLPRSF